MQIGAIQKTTLLDYPGRVACTLFLPGCNLRCPYCHNPDLVLHPGPGQVTEQELFDFLRRRRGKLEGVCITGGEPTVHKDLEDLIRAIRQEGYPVKLDTNGSHPQVLERLLDQNLLNYVAMDIKNCPDRYALTCGGADILPQVRQSVKIIMEKAPEYEFRTTVFAPHHDVQAMEAIGRWLRGARQYFLQAFRDTGDLVGTGCRELDQTQLEALRDAVAPYIENTRIRGI